MKHYFEILELQPGATPDQVKTAYRDLAKVWHPDRFRSDSPRLKSKAAEKLAEINEAYEKIRAYQARQKARKQTDTSNGTGSGTAHTGYRPYTPRPSEGNGSNPNFSGYARPTSGRTQRRRSASGSVRSKSNTYRRSHSSSHAHTSSRSQGYARGTQANGTAGEQATSPLHTLERRRQATVQYGPYGRNYSYAYRKPSRSRNTMAFYLAVVALLAIMGGGTFFFVNKENSAPEPTLADWPPSSSVETPQPTPVNQESPAPQLQNGIAAGGVANEQEGMTDRGRSNPAKQAAPSVPAGYFTLGSSKEAVLMAQGEPEQVRLGLFRYGFSTINFEDNVVVGWQIAKDAPLKVMLKPRRPIEIEYFTLGSSRDEVIAVQGTPDHYREHGRELRFGESRVTFERGRVISWHQNADSPLKAKLLPKVQSTAEHFTYNSTKDEVLSVQGTPDHFGANTFHYGYSTVQFKDDRVAGWNQTAAFPLKIALAPSMPTSSKYFTLGSSRDEVIAAQGTPDQYSERMFKYGYSTVSFENDRVISWYQSSASPPLNVRSDAAG